MELFNRAESTSMLEILHLVFSLGHHAGAATNLESDLAWTKAFAQDMAKILCHPSFQVNSAEDKLARVLQYTVLCRTNDRSLPWKMPGHDLAKPCLGMQRLSRESSQIMEGPLSLHLRAPADGRCDCPECEECHLLVMIGRLIGYRILTTQARVTTFPSEMFDITEADVSVVCRALDAIQPIEVSHEILDQASQSTCQGLFEQRLLAYEEPVHANELEHPGHDHIELEHMKPLPDGREVEIYIVASDDEDPF